MALSYSGFVYQTENLKDLAIQIAEKSVNEALVHIDKVDEATAKDCKTIINMV